ncbi:MAG: endolytic transglycosylase MltG, partial [Oligoflexia bacterium]|nr:endolytic transglycosylase MltG [Oligoflexia bacterium]
DQILKIKSGEYLIPHDTTMYQISQILTTGDNASISVTIPEGKNIFEIARILSDLKITDYQKFVQKAKDQIFLKAIGLPYERAEGFLYPETYLFSKTSSPELIIKSMVKEFRRKTEKVDFSVSKLQLHELITLASIVEKESGSRAERPIIAGVFLNRLEKRIRLQSDPTTIYGIFENFDGDLKKYHLEQATPYNTYKITGLPPGPICNPGMESIMAVLTAPKHKYLYFVSRNDGTHVFNRSYQEHTNAVIHYQKQANHQRKSQQQSP